MRKSTGGFTIVEIIIVIVIIAILATIGFATYGKISSMARDAKRKADIDAIVKQLQIYLAKHSSLPIGRGNSSMLTATPPWQQ